MTRETYLTLVTEVCSDSGDQGALIARHPHLSSYFSPSLIMDRLNIYCMKLVGVVWRKRRGSGGEGVEGALLGSLDATERAESQPGAMARSLGCT